jgi:hypothetical protein
LLEKYKLDQILNLQIQQVETLIGKSDKDWTGKSRAGGQIWVYYNYVWRLSADGRRVFIASGQTPARNLEQGGTAHIRSYAIVSMGPDCLPDSPDS